MKKKYLIWGAVATIGAILIYNWKKGKDTQRKKDEEKVDVDKGTPKSSDASQQNTSNTSSPPSSTPASGVPTGLDVKKFQMWVWKNVERDLPLVNTGETDDAKKQFKSVLCSGNACVYAKAVDGIWGSGTSNAWNAYGQYWDISKNEPTNLGVTKFGYYAKPTTTTTAVTPQPKRPKVYALYGAYLYDNLTDIIPYRMTGYDEYVGESLGVVTHKGVEYYKLYWDVNQVKYISKKYVNRVV